MTAENACSTVTRFKKTGSVTKISQDHRARIESAPARPLDTAAGIAMSNRDAVESRPQKAHPALYSMETAPG